MMKLLIVHDVDGNILGLTEVEAGSRQQRIRVMPRPGQSVIELDKEAHLSQSKPHEILQQFRVDTRTRQLVRR